MFRINHIWAFLAVDDDDEEGVAGAMINGTMMPLIAANEARLHDLRAYAENIAFHSGLPIKLVKFTTREEIEEINGHAN